MQMFLVYSLQISLQISLKIWKLKKEKGSLHRACLQSESRPPVGNWSWMNFNTVVALVEFDYFTLPFAFHVMFHEWISNSIFMRCRCSPQINDVYATRITSRFTAVEFVVRDHETSTMDRLKNLHQKVGGGFIVAQLIFVDWQLARAIHR